MYSVPYRRTLLLALAAVVFLTACKVTPNYLRKWANREGSEEMFIEHLQNPDNSHEVHVTALELLIEQWDYSAPFLRDGGAIRDMPDAEEREATIRDATPHLRSLYDEGGSMRIKMRDAAYHILQAAEGEEAREGLIAVLEDWLTNHWIDPCEIQGTVTLPQVLGVLGRQRGEPHLTRVITESDIRQVLCLNEQIRELSWLTASDAVASAYTSRWDAGLGEDVSEQWQFNFLEQFRYQGQNPVMRAWFFTALENPELNPTHALAILEMLTTSAADDQTGDIAGYTQIMQVNPRETRWTAFYRIVEIQGSEGLDHALSSLPADGDYTYFNGAVREDGFKRAATGMCELELLDPLGDNARLVFESHVTDENLYARVLSIRCLQEFGTSASSIPLLQAQLPAEGTPPVAIPGWGPAETATLSALLTETIAAIQARESGTPEQE